MPDSCPAAREAPQPLPALGAGPGRGRCRKMGVHGGPGFPRSPARPRATCCLEGSPPGPPQCPASRGRQRLRPWSCGRCRPPAVLLLSPGTPPRAPPLLQGLSGPMAELPPLRNLLLLALAFATCSSVLFLSPHCLLHEAACCSSTWQPWSTRIPLFYGAGRAARFSGGPRAVPVRGLVSREETGDQWGNRAC